MKKKLKPGKKTNGFTLIEVLIAMLVIAIGVLGVAALQFQALKYSHDAYLRSQINVLANDIIDRIRLNRANASDYASNYTVGNTEPACTQTDTLDAKKDLNCWRQLLNRTLPPGSLAVISENTATRYTVTLSWLSRDATVPTDVSYAFAISNE